MRNEHRPRWKQEFPDFDDNLGPGQPLAPMLDSSWHNDACPNFTYHDPESEDHGLALVRLWVDYLDPERREASGPRFTLAAVKLEYRDDESSTHATTIVLQAETWAELRMRLNAWYVDHVGYSPDEEHAKYEGSLVPLGELVQSVGILAYLHVYGADCDRPAEETYADALEEAAKDVVACWDGGDLANAVRRLDQVLKSKGNQK